MSCNGVRTALAECLLKSDCVLKSEPPRTPHECLQHHSDALPIECQQLRKAFFECKRGMETVPWHRTSFNKSIAYRNGRKGETIIRGFWEDVALRRDSEDVCIETGIREMRACDRFKVS